MQNGLFSHSLITSSLLTSSILLVTACSGGGGSGSDDNETPDTTAPTLSLNGDNPLTLEVGTVYVNPGANASDDTTQNLNIQISGDVGYSELGDYEVSYTVTDEAGNTTTLIRTVNVVDTTAPVISLTEAEPDTLIQYHPYEVPDYTVTDNYDTDLTATVESVDLTELGKQVLTISATDSSGNTRTLTHEYTVIVGEPFVTTWTPELINGEYTVQLKTPGARNIMIDWGDGAIETYSQVDEPTHIYSGDGDYIIEITGDLGHFIMDPNQTVGDVVSLTQWGDIAWKSMEEMFKNNSTTKTGPKIIQTSNPPLLKYAKTTAYMFYNAQFQPVDFSDWDVSRIERMDYMFGYPVFSNDTTFRGYIQGIDQWDISSVKSMEGMFKGNRPITPPIDNWDVSKVENMKKMFEANTMFDENSNSMWPINDLANWNTESATDMSFMFADAYYFGSDLSSWNTSNVTNLDFFVLTSYNFKYDSVASWDISNVTSMIGMFGCFAMPTSDYDQILNNWSQLNTKENVTFDAGLSESSSQSIQAKTFLEQDKGWTIYDNQNNSNVCGK